MPRTDASITPLAGGGSWISGTMMPNLADRITGSVFSDQGGTLFIEQSGDNANWDVSQQFAVVGGTGQGFSVEALLPWVRARYVNGATPQTAFRVFVRTSSAGSR